MSEKSSYSNKESNDTEKWKDMYIYIYIYIYKYV